MGIGESAAISKAKILGRIGPAKLILKEIKGAYSRTRWYHNTVTQFNYLAANHFGEESLRGAAGPVTFRRRD
jgi:hypothetical protein